LSVIGRVQSLWRYPVKSMRGEELEEAFVGFSGVYGDRLFAFKSSASTKGFPYLTGREQKEMLRYLPRFRHLGQAARPVNLSEAQRIGPGVNPLPADPAKLVVDVETPAGELLAIDDPELLRRLGEGIGDLPVLTLLRSERAMTDCRPLSLISVQTVRRLGEEIGATVDKRRFRANVYLDLGARGAFKEDTLIGRSLKIGAKAVVSILERDPRCKMITLDPETGESSPEILRNVARSHQGMAGVYAAVLVEGTLFRGDAVELLS
jgi:uncharacterized protein YcbX